ncbi:aspartic peptidase domain-containing protein [Phlyctochytrium arcticum]|nr:aspartic peptidase domain-containing protein [Phlyctochytrium arcticum]
MLPTVPTTFLLLLLAGLSVVTARDPHQRPIRIPVTHPDRHHRNRPSYHRPSKHTPYTGHRHASAAYQASTSEQREIERLRAELEYYRHKYEKHPAVQQRPSSHYQGTTRVDNKYQFPYGEPHNEKSHSTPHGKKEDGSAAPVDKDDPKNAPKGQNTDTVGKDSKPKKDDPGQKKSTDSHKETDGDKSKPNDHSKDTQGKKDTPKDSSTEIDGKKDKPKDSSKDTEVKKDKPQDSSKGTDGRKEKPKDDSKNTEVKKDNHYPAPNYEKQNTYKKPSDYKNAKKPKVKKPVAVPAGLDPYDFTGEVKVGNPPQTLKVRFDTGTQLSWLKTAAVEKKSTYGDDYDDYQNPQDGNALLPAFDPTKSKTWKPSGTKVELVNPAGKVSVLNQGKELVSIGGIKVQIALGLKDPAQSKDNDTVAGHFGLSLKNPSLDNEPWMYAAARAGLCDPVFALIPPPVVRKEGYYRRTTSKEQYGPTDYSDYDTYDEPKQSNNAELSICGYDGPQPSAWLPVSKMGLENGFWQIYLHGLSVGQTRVPLVKTSKDSYGYTSSNKNKPIEALIDSGSPFMMLPDIAVDKVHKLLKATCPYDKTYGSHDSASRPNTANNNSSSTAPGPSPLLRGSGIDAVNNLCELQCNADLPPVTLVFEKSTKFQLTREQYVFHSGARCFSLFTRFTNGEDTKEDDYISQGTLAILGTSFTQSHLTVYDAGDVGQGSRMRSKRQLTAQSTFPMVGLMVAGGLSGNGFGVGTRGINATQNATLA